MPKLISITGDHGQFALDDEGNIWFWSSYSGWMKQERPFPAPKPVEPARKKGK